MATSHAQAMTLTSVMHAQFNSEAGASYRLQPSFHELNVIL